MLDERKAAALVVRRIGKLLCRVLHASHRPRQGLQRRFLCLIITHALCDLERPLCDSDVQVRMQLAKESRVSLVQTSAQLYRQDGVSGFYKGLSAGLLRQSTYGIEPAHALAF